MWLDFFRVAFVCASGFAPLVFFFAFGLGLCSFGALAYGFAPLGFLWVWLRASLL